MLVRHNFSLVNFVVDDLTISSMEDASCNVLVLRHSHVYWLGLFVQSNLSELFADF